MDAVLPLLFSLRNTGWKHAAPIMDGMMMHMEYVGPRITIVKKRVRKQRVKEVVRKYYRLEIIEE